MLCHDRSSLADAATIADWVSVIGGESDSAAGARHTRPDNSNLSLKCDALSMNICRDATRRRAANVITKECIAPADHGPARRINSAAAARRALRPASRKCATFMRALPRALPQQPCTRSNAGPTRRARRIGAARARPPPACPPTRGPALIRPWRVTPTRPDSGSKSPGGLLHSPRHTVSRREDGARARVLHMRQGRFRFCTGPAVCVYVSATTGQARNNGGAWVRCARTAVRPLHVSPFFFFCLRPVGPA